MSPRRILSLALMFIAAAVLRSAPAISLEHAEKLTLASKEIGQTYDLLVSLPHDYAKSDRSYPVLYVLDGWHFPLMFFIQDNNLYSGRMPPVIIVNISHGSGINPMPLRARDFTPTPGADEPTAGGAQAFLKFLEHDLIPFIEHSYRANPSDRGLLGHSYGGLFALYALEQRPGLFHRIVAASPVAGWDNNLLMSAARERLKNLPHPVRLDLSAGDEGADEHEFMESTAAFARLLDEIKPPGLEYRFTVFPGENHNSVRLTSFPHGLYWVYGR